MHLPVDDPRVDDRTIDRARSGDPAAQAALLGRLQDLWFRFCVSQLGDADAARDATQETALRVLRSLPAWRGQGRIESWTIGIAINVMREQRRVDRRNNVDRLARGRPAAEFEFTADAAAPFGQDEVDLLRSTLSGLPERQRQAVALRFFEGYSVEETAAAMACAPGTIKATVHQALRALRRKLAAGETR